MSELGGPPLSATIDDAGVGVITIDHPPLNLITLDVFVELAGAINALAVDERVRAVVLRSAVPEWFAAHFDVEAILDFPQDQPHPERLNGFHAMCESLRTMPKPTIAEISGRVGGGGSEIALSCDMRFASPDAVFNQPEVALGIIPGGSGTVRLPRLIGRARALEVILGCDDIDAHTAESWGWINRVLPSDELGPFVDRLARRIAGFVPEAVAAAKAHVIAAEGDVRDELLAEGATFNSLLAVPESRRAMARFMELGGQTLDGERHLGGLAGQLSETD